MRRAAGGDGRAATSLVIGAIGDERLSAAYSLGRKAQTAAGVLSVARQGAGAVARRLGPVAIADRSIEAGKGVYGVRRGSKRPFLFN